jgi:hypothetical protein
MRSLLTAAALSACSLLVACGGGNEGDSDSDQVRQVVKDYTQAISGNKPKKLCDLLVTRKIAEAPKDERDKQLETCRKRVKTQDFSGAPKPQQVKVGDVKVDGNKATAKVTTGTGKTRQSSRVNFRKVDDSWRILAGT